MKKNSGHSDGKAPKMALRQAHTLGGAEGSMDSVQTEDRQQEKAQTYPIRNLNFFMDSADHRMLRMHAIEKDKSLQSIMAEALNLYLEQHGLGPIRLVKAYRLNGGPSSRSE